MNTLTCSHAGNGNGTAAHPQTHTEEEEDEGGGGGWGGGGVVFWVGSGVTVKNSPLKQLLLLFFKITCYDKQDLHSARRPIHQQHMDGASVLVAFLRRFAQCTRPSNSSTRLFLRRVKF